MEALGRVGGCREEVREEAWGTLRGVLAGAAEGNPKGVLEGASVCTLSL